MGSRIRFASVCLFLELGRGNLSPVVDGAPEPTAHQRVTEGLVPPWAVVGFPPVGWWAGLWGRGPFCGRRIRSCRSAGGPVCVDPNAVPFVENLSPTRDGRKGDPWRVLRDLHAVISGGGHPLCQPVVFFAPSGVGSYPAFHWRLPTPVCKRRLIVSDSPRCAGLAAVQTEPSSPPTFGQSGALLVCHLGTKKTARVFGAWSDERSCARRSRILSSSGESWGPLPLVVVPTDRPAPRPNMFFSHFPCWPDFPSPRRSVLVQRLGLLVFVFFYFRPQARFSTIPLFFHHVRIKAMSLCDASFGGPDRTPTPFMGYLP